MSNLLEYKGYQGSVEYSSEDDLLFGKVLHVDSLIQYDGKTVTQIRTAFRHAVDGYLAMCERTGRTPNKPYSGTFNVRVGPELHREAVMAAAKRKLNLNEFVRRAIQSMLSGPGTQSVTNYNTYNYTILDTSTEGTQNWSTGHVSTAQVQH
jgi:predicted HicB family RNase H-like nuclease